MNILTFDIEEWFHILDNESTKGEDQWRKYEYRLAKNTDRILALLQDENQTATFFVLGWVARKFPQIVRQIHELGYEIATHSDLHQLAYSQSRKEFEADLQRSVRCISDLTGAPVTSYRAPGFSLKSENAWVFEALAENGISIDCSVFPARRAHGGFDEFAETRPAIVARNGVEIKEFPINVHTAMGRKFIFSGGGYFRALPYPVIRHLFRKANYVMTYFHPRDFDAGQPLIDGLSPVRRFKSYYGLQGALAKLRNLVREFEFIDLREADRAVDWKSASRVSV